MRIELNNGEIFELSDHEAWALYETLLERGRQRGASSAARKLRPALTWSSEAGTMVALDQFETAAVQAAREEDRPASRPTRESVLRSGISARERRNEE